MTSRPDHVILDELDPDEEERYEAFQDKELGTADPLKIKPRAKAVGKYIVKQYQKLPEEFREDVKENTSEFTRQLSIGLQPETFPDGTKKPNTFDILSKVYEPIAEVKKAGSKITSLDPIYFDLAELGIDLATLNPTATRKLLNKAKILNKVFPTANPFKTTEILSLIHI